MESELKLNFINMDPNFNNYPLNNRIGFKFSIHN